MFILEVAQSPSPIITVLEIYFGELFSNITNPKACFQVRKIW